MNFIAKITNTTRCFLLFIGLNFTVIACLQWDANEHKINDYFSISWVDVPNKQGISFSSKPHSNSRTIVVEAYVFAIGNDEDFIIAKQHPCLDRHCDKLNKSKTNYFILQNIYSESGEYRVHGPLDSLRFERIKKQLDLEDLEFSLLFPDDPAHYGIMQDYL